MFSEQFLDAHATSIHIARQLTPPIQRAILETVYQHIAASAPVEKFEKAARSVFKIGDRQPEFGLTIRTLSGPKCPQGGAEHDRR